jgi:hypothetical protein
VSYEEEDTPGAGHDEERGKRKKTLNKQAEASRPATYERKEALKTCVICGGGYMCHMRRRIHVSYEEEDTCVI